MNFSSHIIIWHSIAPVDQMQEYQLRASEALEKLLNASDGLTIAFLTILVPLTVAVLQDYFTKKKDELSFAELDLHVILDYVAPLKSLLAYAAIPYIAQVVWPLLSFNLQLVVGGLLIFALVQIGAIIIDLYKWSKGNQTAYRFAYLKTSAPKEDLLIAWRSVWQTEPLGYREEESYFQIFTQIVKRFLEDPTNRTETDARLLEIFRDNLYRRSLNFLDMGNSLKQALQWHYLSATRAKERLGDDVMVWHRYDYPEHVLGEIIYQTVQRIVSHVSSHTHGMYRAISEHTKAHEENKDYLQDLILSLMRSIFDGLDALQENKTTGTIDVLRALPREWRITSELLRDSNFYSLVIRRAFFDWIENRIYHAQSQFDGVAEAVVSRLFPKAEPITFSKLMHFYFLMRNQQDLVEVIKSPRSFGHIGRMFTSSGEDEADIDQRYKDSLELQTKESFTLARMLFRPTFSDKNLKQYIAELDKIDTTDTETKDQAQRWRALFRSMLDIK